MIKQLKIAVLGGDMRQTAVAKNLSDAGFQVYASGLFAVPEGDSNVNNYDSWEQSIKGAYAVILPLPVSLDDNKLNCPSRLGEDRITLDSLIGLVDKNTILFGGRIPKRMLSAATEKGIRVYDYFLSESLQIKNAHLTAEAAVSIAMNSLDKRLGESRIAITGSGRIAHFLAHILRRLGVGVTVAARNTESLTYFASDGCDTILMRESDEKNAVRWYERLRQGYDIIFNTVPSWIFDRNFLEVVDKNTLIIELASSPGGVDICAARELSSNVMWAPSLPGKYAPESAGRIISECILETLGGGL